MDILSPLLVWPPFGSSGVDTGGTGPTWFVVDVEDVSPAWAGTAVEDVSPAWAGTDVEDA